MRARVCLWLGIELARCTCWGACTLSNYDLRMKPIVFPADIGNKAIHPGGKRSLQRVDGGAVARLARGSDCRRDRGGAALSQACGG